MTRNFLTLLVILSLFSCKKEVQDPANSDPVNPPSTSSVPTVTGTVIDSSSFINFRVGTGPYFTFYQSVTYDETGKFVKLGRIGVSVTENIDVTTGKVSDCKVSVGTDAVGNSQGRIYVTGERSGAAAVGTYTRGFAPDYFTYYPQNGNVINVEIYASKQMKTTVTTLNADRCIGTYTAFTILDSLYPVTGSFNVRRK